MWMWHLGHRLGVALAVLEEQLNFILETFPT